MAQGAATMVSPLAKYKLVRLYRWHLPIRSHKDMEIRVVVALQPLTPHDGLHLSPAAHCKADDAFIRSVNLGFRRVSASHVILYVS